MFWYAVVLTPFPPVNVQVIICVPCVEYVRGSEVVPTIVAPQESVVVGMLAVAVHCPVTSAKVGVVGGVANISALLNEADAAEVQLPLSEVTV
ncbi:hypothetical protein D3C85_839010 [compost metagenome]